MNLNIEKLLIKMNYWDWKTIFKEIFKKCWQSKLFTMITFPFMSVRNWNNLLCKYSPLVYTDNPLLMIGCQKSNFWTSWHRMSNCLPSSVLQKFETQYLPQLTSSEALFSHTAAKIKPATSLVLQSLYQYKHEWTS